MYKLNEKIANLTPYDPVSGDYKIRLDANESFLEMPEDVRQDMMRRIEAETLNRYPDHRADEICSLFADIVRVGKKYVTATNGLDEALAVIINSFLMKGEGLLTLNPDFTMYKLNGHLCEARLVTLEQCDLSDDWSGKICKTINENDVKLFIFSNPGNPWSLGITADEVLRVVENCPDCLIVSDEAYMDFWDQSIAQKILEYDNLMVLKTCSKAYRLAGARCGFVLANERLSTAVKACKSPYNVSRLNQAAVAAMLSKSDDLKAATARILEEKKKMTEPLRAALDKLGIKLPESHANFFFIPANGLGEKIYEYLKTQGIIIRLMGDNLRITVGSEDENRALVDAIEKFIIHNA